MNTKRASVWKYSAISEQLGFDGLAFVEGVLRFVR